MPSVFANTKYGFLSFIFKSKLQNCPAGSTDSLFKDKQTPHTQTDTPNR